MVDCFKLVFEQDFQDYVAFTFYILDVCLYVFILISVVILVLVAFLWLAHNI